MHQSSNTVFNAFTTTIWCYVTVKIKQVYLISNKEIDTTYAGAYLANTKIWNFYLLF